MTQFLWVDVQPAGEQLLGKRFKDDPATARALLDQSLQALESVGGWGHEELEGSLRALAEQAEVKPRDLFGLLRVAVTGAEVSPPLFESMAVLGREASVGRVGAALEQLAQDR